MSLKPNSLEFQGIVLDLDEKILAKDGRPVSLPPKALDLLLTLVRQPGHIFEKEELLETVWPNTFVEEGNLTYTVRLLRKALGDDAENPTFIETVPRRGYRFIADVVRTDQADELRPRSAQVLLDPDDATIGRTREIAEVTELLGRDRVRLVTLTGPGGTGKTRLSKEVGRKAGEPFPDGVYFIGLETVTDPLLVPTVIVHALAIREGSWNDSAQALISELRERAALLILDNFEQILGAAPFVARLMAETRRLKILVTSREPLHLTLENEYLVPPLSFPSQANEESAFALSRYESVEFFIERARQVRHSFEIFESDIRAVAGICRRLDGLPLALELAAARARLLTAPEILEKLEHGLALLTGGARDLPDRQQTMRAAIAWSYDLLNDLEKDVFAKLSIFEGGFTFEAVEAVVSPLCDSRTEVEILDAVTSLSEKNLLVTADGSESQRFRMLVVVREFAMERLEELGAEAIARAHAEYCAQLAEKAEPELQSGNVASWVERLEREHDNLRAALKWSITQDHEIAVRIAKSIRLFWMLRGYTREAQYWYAEVLKVKNILSKFRWVLLTGLANMTQFLGDLEGALDAYRQALEESRRLGDPQSIAQATRGVAGALYMLGDYENASRRTLEALETSEKIGDDFGTAAATARLGDIALAENRPAEARLYGTKALELFRQIGFMPGVASKLMNLGMADVADGDIDAGREHLSESLQLATEIGDYITTRLALEGIAFVMFEEGRYRDAARLSAAARRMGTEIDHNLEPAETRLRELYIEKLKQTLGDEYFPEACESGHSMERSNVIKLALGDDRDPVENIRIVSRDRAAARRVA